MWLDSPLGHKINKKVFMSIRNPKKHQVKPLRMTPYLERVIAKAEKDLKNKKNLSPVFTNAHDAIEYLKQL